MGWCLIAPFAQLFFCSAVFFGGFQRLNPFARAFLWSTDILGIDFEVACVGEQEHDFLIFCQLSRCSMEFHPSAVAKANVPKFQARPLEDAKNLAKWWHKTTGFYVCDPLLRVFNALSLVLEM